MTKSEQFLMEAFAGESQANRKYLAFAKQAEKEGYPQVAKLFRAAAAAETVHAHAHLRTVGGIKTTAENLKAAIAGEIHEFEHMYPEMIAAAQAEANKGGGTELQLRQRGGKDSRRPVPEGPGQPGPKIGKRGLLRVFRVRLHLRRPPARQVSGVQQRRQGLFQGGLTQKSTAAIAGLHGGTWAVRTRKTSY